MSQHGRLGAIPPPPFRSDSALETMQSGDAMPPPPPITSQGAPKERRRRRAEKRLSKRVFLESPFLLCSPKVFLKHLKGPENFKGAEETDSPKAPFWTTVSPHDPFAAPLARPQIWHLSDNCVIPYETRQNACDTPLCDTISKGYCATWGGILHWVAKIRESLRGV